jgi:phage gpG-like protein
VTSFSIETGPDFDRMVVKVAGLPTRAKQALADALLKSMTHIKSAVLLSGRVPYKTGTLRRSITTKVETSGDIADYEGEIGTNLPYAAIHEYGGTFTRYSAWGRPTKPYEVTYQERAYIRVPFTDALPTVQRIFENELGRVVDLS